MFMHGGRFFANSYHMFNPWFFYGGKILGLLVLVLIGFLVYKLIKKNNSKDNNLQEILKMKYIEGKITEEEYLKKIEILKK